MNNFFGMRAGYAAPASMLILLAACGSRQLRLVTPDTTAGTTYTCVSGEGKVCQPAMNDVPSDLNPSNTAFVVLPRECKGRIYQITVFDPGGSDPKVEATCAPREEPVDEMSRSEPGSAKPGSTQPGNAEPGSAQPRSQLIAGGAQ